MTTGGPHRPGWPATRRRTPGARVRVAPSREGTNVPGCFLSGPARRAKTRGAPSGRRGLDDRPGRGMLRTRGRAAARRGTAMATDDLQALAGLLRWHRLVAGL